MGVLDDIKAAKKNLNTSSDTITTAHTTFTNQFTSFLVLAEQLEKKAKELEEREIAVVKLEKGAKVLVQQIEERENKCKKREKEVGMREIVLTSKMAMWNETEKRMEENAAKLPNVIHFNVSGTRFSIEKEKLFQHKGSLFEQMITTSHPPLLSNNNGEHREMFINRDPVLFSYVVRFLLHGELILPPQLKEQELLSKEFEYFKLPFGGQNVNKPTQQSTVSTPRPFDTLLNNTLFVDKINEWLPNKTFKLLYKATKHGFSAGDFHEYCDNKGSTLTLIRSKEGYLFGGYSVLPWDSTTGYKEHPDGFIFTLSNPHNIPPTKYHRSQSKNAIYCKASYGPTFGDSHDIRVASNSNQNNNGSYTEIGSSYVDLTGKGQATFTGSFNFVTSDIEVFSVL